MHRYIHTRIHAYVYTHTYLHKYTHTCTHVHALIHVHMLHTYTHADALGMSLVSVFYILYAGIASDSRLTIVLRLRPHHCSMSEVM